MHIGYVGCEQLICIRIGLHAALHKIRRVKGGAHVGAVERFAPCGGVAVNSLFVFMQQGQTASLRRVDEPVPPFQYLVGVIFRILPLGDKKAEHTNKFGLHHLSDLHDPLELVEVWAKFVANPDLADGGADGRQGESPCVHLAFDFFCFSKCAVAQILAVDPAHLDVLDTVLVQNLHLCCEVHADLVCKRA